MGKRFMIRVAGWLLMLTCSGVRAADVPPVFYLGIEHGLSNNEVNCIYQSRNGYFWVGTFDGLNRYDGYGFRVYRQRIGDPGSLVSNRIQDILEDEGERLWIATMGGISIYDPSTEKFHTPAYIPFGQQSPRTATNITALDKDLQQRVFAGTVAEGLLVHDPQKNTASQVSLLTRGGPVTSYHVSSIETAPGGQTWVFVEGRGLCRYDPRQHAVIPVSGVLRQSACLRADSSGHLWLGTPTGVYRYTVASDQYTFHPLPRAVTGLHLNRLGEIWASTDGGGIHVFDGSGQWLRQLAKENGKDIFTSMAIKSVWEDLDGRYWIATLRGGINVIDARRHLFETFTPGSLKKEHYDNYFISAFCESRNGEVWIGTDGNGISCWNRAANTYQHFMKDGRNGLSSGNITGLLSDRDGRIWVATWGGGIHQYDPATQRFEQFACRDPEKKADCPHAWKLFEDRERQLWASTYGNGGLFRFNQRERRFELFDGSVGNVLTMAEDSRGRMWAGTDNQLLYIRKDSKTHLRYTIGCRVRSIVDAGNDRLWLGTEGGGLLFFNTASGEIRRFTENDGLPNNAVLNILPGNDGSLWLSTSNGLSRYDTATGKFRNFSASDGLQSNQFSYAGALQLSTGELMFGGIKGMNLFCPASVRLPEKQLPVMLSEIMINNVPLSDSANLRYVSGRSREGVTRLRIPYSKASLAFEYVALEYSTPDKVNYAYFLEGWDKDWIPAGKVRAANYSRLEAGEYILRIRASDSRNEWGPETRLHIHVLPPWYRSWWAYSLYVFLICAVVYAYTRYRRKQAHMAYEVLLAQLETKQEKELNEKKLSFFTNITHELRTPLTLIVNPVKEMLGKAEHDSKHDLNIVYRNASRLLTLVDQLLLFRSAEDETSRMQISRFDLYQLCRDTFECFMQMAQSRGIRYELVFEGGQLFMSGDARKLEIVLFNLISNAIKFTPAQGAIVVELRDAGKDVEIRVADTGCGMEDHVKSRLFEKYYRGKKQSQQNEAGYGIGLYLVKQFVDGHGGTLECTSSSERGTTFEIRLEKNRWPDAGTEQAREWNKPEGRMEQLPDAPAQDAPNIDLLEITEKKSLLVVDDNSELRQYLKKMFADRYIFYEAADGAAGWELAHRHVPDIVISDVLMEGFTGVELCRKIKQDPFLNHIPVILLSGLGSAANKLQGIESGAEDYITKPFDQELLAARIRTILENRNALQQYFRDNIALREHSQKISITYRAFLEKCIAIIEENLDNEELNPRFLASQCNMSYSNLYKKVKSVSGLSINAFIRSIRLRKAALLILSTNVNVNEAAYQSGIYDLKYFRKQFRNLYGMNPSEYKKKYQHSFNREFNLIVRTQAQY